MIEAESVNWKDLKTVSGLPSYAIPGLLSSLSFQEGKEFTQTLDDLMEMIENQLSIEKPPGGLMVNRL